MTRTRDRQLGLLAALLALLALPARGQVGFDAQMTRISLHVTAAAFTGQPVTVTGVGQLVVTVTGTGYVVMRVPTTVTINNANNQPCYTAAVVVRYAGIELGKTPDGAFYEEYLAGGPGVPAGGWPFSVEARLTRQWTFADLAGDYSGSLLVQFQPQS